MSASDSAISPALETLYCDHHCWLQGWLQRRLGNAADAADLAQDAFVRLLGRSAFPRFDSVAEARGYLRSIGNGLCIDLWRHREVEKAWLEALAAQPQAFVPSLEHQAIVIESLLEVGRMLGRLPHKAATAFVMAQVEGLPYREIASHLNVSERMVKKYIVQAMLQCALIDAGLA